MIAGEPDVAYRTRLGSMYLGRAEDILKSHAEEWNGRVTLVLTSPPFPLNRKKRYGNLTGQRYSDWLATLANPITSTLSPSGSIVMELGNAWEPGRPIMSTLTLRSLLSFLDAGRLNLCQEFVCYNPARLPTPAQWVTVERIRVKDAYTHLWWMSPSDRPKAHNRTVLIPYSRSMRSLLKRGSYNAGRRPSEHNIRETSFLKDNSGAIPSNVLTFSNTSARDAYRRYCREHGLTVHPARMQAKLVEFFIKFLTDEGDLVLDPFAGSNTTGAIAERLGRRWVAIEPDPEYVDGSKGRFQAGVMT